MWEALQVLAIDVPANIFYNGLYGGLAWIWYELGIEVKDFAKQVELDNAHDEHVPNVAPSEGGFDEEETFDIGNVGDLADEGDTGGL